ncbi:OmpP1/FadL family transporter [Chryseobacterium sp. JUb7]|uniref:OmpP1/FadL family transporter n=1 Tax=Chryseobacterium sp. JUb7 TaxID=2940599 RepID=UPI002167321D|nr:hypothetical protein [Chryseobacterium sp. JUb7]MCS3531826.1 hypothetical protein [Chryseobacterium sp. JUb7]
MNKKNKAGVALLLSCAFTSVLYAQNSSPYSYFGIGGFNNVDDARNIALGNTGIALDAPDYINSKNSASMTGISTRNVIFNVSGILKYNSISSNLGTDKRLNSNFTNFSAALRISKNAFVGISIQSTTSSDYKISSTIPIEGTSNEYPVTYEGSGGLSNWGISLAYKINDNWSFGGKIKNNFGTIVRKETISTISEVEISRNIRYTGFSYNLGTQFKKDFTDNFQLTLGGTVNFGSKLVSKREVSYTEDQDYTNTVTSKLSSRDSSLPLEMGVGIGILAKERYRMTFDFTQNNWDKVKNTETSEQYYRQNVYGLGFEILPGKKRFENISEAFIYRFGLNYDTGYYTINKAKIDKLEITAGLGIPLNKVNLNIGYGYGIHGFQKNVSIKENYHMLNISMNILDTWFRKKYIE